MDNQDEILIVVDEDDNVIDYLPRKLVHERKLLHRTITISVFNEKGQILLHKRSQNKDSNAGKIANSSGGHVSKGKEYEEAARDEIKEELGITPELTFIKKMIINDPVHTTMTCIYKAYSNEPFNINKDEIDAAIFYNKEDLASIKGQMSESARIILHEQGLI